MTCDVWFAGEVFQKYASFSKDVASDVEDFYAPNFDIPHLQLDYSLLFLFVTKLYHEKESIFFIATMFEWIMTTTWKNCDTCDFIADVVDNHFEP